MGNREKGGTQHFRLFSECFLCCQRQIISPGPDLECHYCRCLQIEQVLTFKTPFGTIVAFVDNVNQDQASQNVQPDL